METTYNAKRIRAGLTDFMASQPYTHALTLNTDREMSVETLRSIFGTFCVKIDRFVHGIQRVRQLPASDRLNAIAFPEHLSTNAHLHGMADLSRLRTACRNEGDLAKVVHRIWRQSTRGAGSVDVTPLYSFGFGSYATKEVTSADASYFLAADFYPR